MVELKNISFGYLKNEGYILSDFNLKINRGEVVSIVGTSGIGKTTLVDIIAGFLRPTKGNVFINEEKVIRPSKKRIVINQEDDLFAWMSIYENMKIATNNIKEINNFLDICGLHNYKNMYPYQLSGGMKKRLSIARAFATRAEFIIMDEPFSSLDFQTKEKIQLELLNIIENTKKTILLITHDIEEAVFMSDRIIVLTGYPAEIKKNVEIKIKKPRILSWKESLDFLKINKEIKNLLR